MSTSNTPRNDRLSARRFRAPLAVTSSALLGFSLLLSVGPALAANNHSTNGTVRVHDAATGAESGGNGNEPHVCDFWLSFALDAPFEAGTWVVVSWAPTGDGSTVTSGVYDTTGDGVDSSSVIDLPAGHYRVEWAAAGESVSNKKTFWVDAECDESVTPEDESPAEDGSPAEDASPAEESESASPVEESLVTDEESPAEESESESPTEDASPAEESFVTDGESLAEDASPAEDGSPLEESLVTDEESPAEDSAPAEDESPGDESVLGSEGSSNDGPGSENPGSPSDESPTTPGDPSDGEGEEAAQAADGGATDSPAPPTQNALGGTGTSDEPTMTDTATPTLPVPNGIVATFGVLMLIVAHATARRGKRSAGRA